MILVTSSHRPPLAQRGHLLQLIVIHILLPICQGGQGHGDSTRGGTHEALLIAGACRSNATHMLPCLISSACAALQAAGVCDCCIAASLQRQPAGQRLGEHCNLQNAQTTAQSHACTTGR